MRILLDHNLDWRLWELLQPHEVTTTRRMQWDRYENGDLLDVAQTEFDCLLTTDTNLYHQNKVAKYDLAVIVLRAYQNSMEAVSPLMGQVMDLLDAINPGETHYVYVDEKLRERDERRGKGPYAKNQPP
jgi:predicted nuclease of predicted toxin-antitoxin system